MRDGKVDNVSDTAGGFVGAFLDYGIAPERGDRGARFGARGDSVHRELRTWRRPGERHEQLRRGQRGLSAQVNLDRPGWSMFASIRGYDYSDYDCRLESAQLPEVVHPAAAEAAAVRSAGSSRASSATRQRIRVTSRAARTALLASSMSVGAMLPLSERWYGERVYRDVEELGDRAYGTALLFAGYRLSRIWNTEFSVDTPAPMWSKTRFSPACESPPIFRSPESRAPGRHWTAAPTLATESLEDSGAKAIVVV